MKKILVTIILFVCATSCQTVKNINSKDLEKVLLDFLIQNGDIHKLELDDYKSGKRDISIKGFFSNSKKEVLINGIYMFYQNKTHSKNYYVIVENGKNIILNISSRQGLDLAIKDVLDFCDRNKICADITEEYVNRMVSMYYRKNKNPMAGIDVNCERGISDTKNLP